MVDPGVVRRKLRSLEGYLSELEQVRPESFKAYTSDARTRRAVERLIQLLVDVANDINVHAIVDAGHPPPADYHDGFIKAADIGLIPRELGQRLAPAAGERNILVHEYEEIDDRVVYESISEALELFREYARSILAELPPP